MYIKGSKTAEENSYQFQLLEPLEPDQWEIPASQVVIEEQLGEGCFGEVYKGTVQGTLTNPKLQPAFRNKLFLTVAIKLLKGQLSMWIHQT